MRRSVAPAGGEALEHREHECGRLAGARLGAGEQVAAIQHERDRLALDGSWFGVTLARDSAEQVGLKPEGSERQVRELLTEAHPPVRDKGGARSGRGVVRVGRG